MLLVLYAQMACQEMIYLLHALCTIHSTGAREYKNGTFWIQWAKSRDNQEDHDPKSRGNP